MIIQFQWREDLETLAVHILLVGVGHIFKSSIKHIKLISIKTMLQLKHITFDAKIYLTI
jgi:hypothetical protein